MKNNTDVDEHINSPFHKGEKALQRHVGKHETAEKMARRMISNFIPDQHRQFYNQLPFLVVGSVDDEGWPWASFLSAKPGFLHSPTPESLDINTTPFNNDPLGESIKTGKPLGLLGIELTTRRRNRLNAHVSETHDNAFSVKVDQAFGNCPQYIQLRDMDFIHDPEAERATQKNEHFSRLDNEAKRLITKADTFFVSSFVPTKEDASKEGVDVSHRGGKSGFVKVEENTLTIPDYPGNNLFNTLGNFLVNPKAGLIFPDFETGNLLMLTGTVELLWETEEEVSSYKGAERAWRFTLDHGLRLIDALPFREKLREYTPNSLRDL